MAYDNDMSGILTKNDRKTTDKHPTHRGSCEINGVQYWISAWVKEGRDGTKLAGQKYFSLSFQAKDEQPAAAPAAAPKAAAKPAPTGFHDMDDDSDSIPF